MTDKKSSLLAGMENATDKGPWYEGTAGERIAVRLSSTDTNGAYAIVESVAAPGCSPPMHLHRNEEEHFVVLAGTYRRFGYSGDISCKRRTEGRGKRQSGSAGDSAASL